MTLLGLDFDNTLVRYDELFHQLALERNLIMESLPPDKTTIRDYLRSQGKDEQFTLLQGEAYGLRILEAKPNEGVINALTEIKKKGIDMAIISHKTRRPYKGPAYDLHKGALDWLNKHNFFSESGVNMLQKDVYFENTKEQKLKKIKELGCDYFVDDLKEIVMAIEEPTKAILYARGLHQEVETMTDWKELIELIK